MLNPLSFLCRVGIVHSNLKLVGVDILYLLRLDTKVFKGLLFRAVIEADHEFWRTPAIGYPLVIAPRFPKGVAPKVALQVDGFAPLFHQSVDRWHG